MRHEKRKEWLPIGRMANASASARRAEGHDRKHGEVHQNDARARGMCEEAGPASPPHHHEEEKREDVQRNPDRLLPVDPVELGALRIWHARQITWIEAVSPLLQDGQPSRACEGSLIAR